MTMTALLEDFLLKYLRPWRPDLRREKTGRLADQEERERARALAAFYRDLYEKANKEPDGLLCLNPDAEPEDQDWFDGRNPEHLLLLLERFAEEGTFSIGVTEYAASKGYIAGVYSNLRKSGMSRTEAVQILAEKLSLSERTIERTVSGLR